MMERRGFLGAIAAAVAGLALRRAGTPTTAVAATPDPWPTLTFPPVYGGGDPYSLEAARDAERAEMWIVSNDSRGAFVDFDKIHVDVR